MKIEGGENPWIGKRQKITEKKGHKSLDDCVSGYDGKGFSEAENMAEHIIRKIMFRTNHQPETRDKITEVLERYAHKYAAKKNKELIEKVKQLEDEKNGR